MSAHNHSSLTCCYLWLQIGCDYTFCKWNTHVQNQNKFVLVAMVRISCLTFKVIQGAFGWLERVTCGQLGSFSHKHPLLQYLPLPCPQAQKRIIVQAGSEARKAWFWLECCAASKTLTFLLGLHLELVSCSSCIGQGRSLAKVCDWPRLSLYGPQASWNCQTVIRQSQAYRFKLEHNMKETLWLV